MDAALGVTVTFFCAMTVGAGAVKAICNAGGVMASTTCGAGALNAIAAAEGVTVVSRLRLGVGAEKEAESGDGVMTVLLVVRTVGPTV
jgi:hypothetical protein